MSKNFEQAYRELAQNEAPDLWDRIEAGLTEKSAPENRIVNENVEIKEKADRTDRNRNSKKITSKKIRAFLGKYAGAVAAVLCVAVILPAAIFLKRTGDKSFSGGAMTEGIDEAGEMQEAAAADMAMPEDAAPESAEAAAEEDTTAGAATGAETADAGAADCGADSDSGAMAEAEADMEDLRAEAEAAKDVEMADSEDGGNITGNNVSSPVSDLEKQQSRESGETRKAEDMEDAISKGTSMLPEGTTLEGVVVEVMGMTYGSQKGSEEELPGSIYTVVVKEDASGRLIKDSEIEVFVPAYASFFLPVGETYAIDIAYEKEGEYPVVKKSGKVEKQ